MTIKCEIIGCDRSSVKILKFSQHQIGLCSDHLEKSRKIATEWAHALIDFENEWLNKILNQDPINWNSRNIEASANQELDKDS